MFKIVILNDDISLSLLRYNNTGMILSELPEKLAMRFTGILKTLTKAGVSGIHYEENHFVLSRGDANYSLDSTPFFLNSNSVFEITEVIKLTNWYLGPHIKARDPERLGGPSHCTDCGHVQPRGVPYSGTCYSSFCPSHKKWVEVIDGYLPPPSVVKSSFPRLKGSESANAWAQKG